MDISALIEAAVAGVEERVEVASLESVGIPDRVSDDLADIVSELVRNAVAFSGPAQKVTVNGVFLTDGYLITVSDDGVGISSSLLSALNRILDNPDPPTEGAGVTMGITAVAAVAARHGFRVRLVPGVPGTTARVTVPLALVTRPLRPEPVQETSPSEPAVVFAPEAEALDLTGRWGAQSPEEPVIPTVERDRAAAEAFLEAVFGPLRGRAAVGRERPGARSTSNGNGQRVVEAVPTRPPAKLSVRVPGANFSSEEVDEHSTTSSEAAVDLRSALARYEQGRRDATS